MHCLAHRLGNLLGKIEPPPGVMFRNKLCFLASCMNFSRKQSKEIDSKAAVLAKAMLVPHLVSLALSYSYRPGYEVHEADLRKLRASMQLNGSRALQRIGL